MKRNHFSHLHTITIALVLAVLCSSRFGKIFTAQGAMPPMPDFNEMFKNFDFEQFASELDEQLKAIEAEEAGAKEAKPVGPQRPTDKTPAKKPPVNQDASEGDTSEATSSDDEVSTDPAQLITKPPIVNVQRDGKTIALPHKKAIEALEAYLHDITTNLQKIDQAALSGHGEEFHEYYLATCGETVTELLVSLAMLSSKKAYRVAVLAPPQELAQQLREYRKNLITVRTNLMKVADSLTVSEKEELTEEELTRKRLEELSRVSLQMTTQEPIKKPTTEPKIDTSTDDTTDSPAAKKMLPAATIDDDLDDLDDDDDEPADAGPTMGAPAKAPYDPSFDFDQLMNGGGNPQDHFMPTETAPIFNPEELA